MRSLIRPIFLTASIIFACGGIPGCSTDASDAGKMDAAKMSPTKSGGAMDKMEPGKMQ
jgi:hypothetical protein